MIWTGNREMNGWKYYNHALLPETSPLEEPDLSSILDNSIWKNQSGGIPFLARWTSDFDCGYETEWWYCIKDTVFDITSINSKRRYDIKKGEKFFYVEKIEPEDYINAILEVKKAAFSAYPKEYRPEITEENNLREISLWKGKDVFAAFNIETKEMGGYAVFSHKNGYIEWEILKTKPNCEKYNINAIIGARCLEFYENKLQQGILIIDGERNILHQTNFQDYLIRYFCFRRAYCHVHVRYPQGIRQVVNILYPFRNSIKNFKGKFARRVYAVLFMEEIVRSQNKKGRS